jgi:3-oxoadipate enol-lactonase
MQATINGIRMNYDVGGKEGATPIVLHHPLATNLTIWDELTAVLSPRYRVVRFDARGHGKTEAPKGAYSFETLAADTIGLMDHLKIDKAHYLGLSMGGMVGQYIGLMHSKRVYDLILVSTSSRVPPEGQGLWDERIKTVREKGMASQPEGSMQRWLAVANRNKPELVARLTKLIETTPADGFMGWGGAIRNLNITDRLKSIALPTRVIVGAEDQATPPAAAEAIHREIKGSDLIVMPGVSHMLCAEDPPAFHKLVLEFLDKVPAK